MIRAFWRCSETPTPDQKSDSRRAPGVIAAVVLVASGALWTGGLRAQVITTFAGGGIGDGIQANQAILKSARGVAIDASGNMYVADALDNRIRKISPAGIISTLAGNGSNYSGFADGVPATHSVVANPADMCADGAGNVYIADTDDYRVRRVAPDGTISTVAGGGSGGFGGPAASAYLKKPQGIAVDAAGNIYVSDANYRVDKITTSGTFELFAGTGVNSSGADGADATQISLGKPSGLAVDAGGNVYVAETSGNRIRRISPSGVATTVAGTGVAGNSGDGGMATAAAVGAPTDVFVDSAGNIYIAEGYGNVIRMVDTSGIISTIAGAAKPEDVPGDGLTATAAGIGTPVGVVAVAGKVYFSSGARVRVVDTGGVLNTYAGGGDVADGAKAIDAVLTYPAAVAFDGAGNLYIADRYGHRVRKVDVDGRISTIAGTGSAGFSGDGGLATAARLSQPQAVAVNAAGEVYIGDAGNGRIRKIATDGTISTVAGDGSYTYDDTATSALATGFPAISALAFDASGNLLVGDSQYGVVRRITPLGALSRIAGGGASDSKWTYGIPATDAYIGQVGGLAVATDGSVFVSDSMFGHVLKITPGGDINWYAGQVLVGALGDGGPATQATLYGAEGLALDGAGNLFIAESSNGRIRRVSSAGIITTMAGSVPGFGGDGGSAAAAKMNSPLGLATDASGNVYVADYQNARVRRVSAIPSGAKVPGAPLAVAAVAGNRSATVTFSPPASDGGSGISGYIVTASPAGGNGSSGEVRASGALRFNAVNLTNGVSYTFKVTAVNALGKGTPSAASSTVTPSAPPVLSISSVSTPEGDSGSHTVQLTASLSTVYSQDVSFNVITGDGTATSGSDYQHTVLTGFVIPAGSDHLTIDITVYGDTLPEGDENFSVPLYGLLNATGTDVSGTTSTGTVSILDDDQVGISISDASIVEGNTGTRSLDFVVALNGVPATPVSFSLATADGTAQAGSDYVAKRVSGSLSDTQPYHFQVAVNGDTTVESNETLHAILETVSGATVVRGTATGTIVNDDTGTAPKPVVAADNYSGMADTNLIADTLTGVLANDADPAGGSLSAAVVSAPAHGHLALATDGSFVFEPAHGYSGVDSFTYSACGAGGCTTGSAKLTLAPLGPSSEHRLWLVPPASNAVQQGFIRLRNLSNVSGTVTLRGVDSAGNASTGAATAVLAPHASLQLNSGDLELGNPDKGLVGALGSGTGDWTIIASSPLSLDALAYIRTVDGFLTAIGDRVPLETKWTWTLPIFNPAANTNQVSRLRLVNPGTAAVSLSLSAVDDAGVAATGHVQATLPAGTALELTSADIEQGNAGKGLVGSLGSGSGKWRVDLQSNGPLTALDLLADPSGYLTDLSTTASSSETAPGERTLWMVPPASNAQQQGFLRLSNTGAACDVAIWGVDDAGHRSAGTVTFTLGSQQAMQLNSADLENGNPAKGLTGAIGHGSGNWRVVVLTDGESVGLSDYIRTPDGFLTSMHDVVAGDGKHVQVPIFNPASNGNQKSSLRVVNPSAGSAIVTITAIDDAGAPAPGGAVVLDLAGGKAIEVTADDLENGNAAKGLTGSLGHGSGKWGLQVEATSPVAIVNLLRDPKGYVTNLSTTPRGTSDSLPQ